VDTLIGVSITDRAFFGITGGRHIEDVALLGAWHGNNDGPDWLDNVTIRNCFLVAHDDNLKLNHNTHAKHIVIWQLENAHPVMVKEVRDNVKFSNSIVEDIDIIAYFRPMAVSPWHKLSMSAIACITGGDMEVSDFTFRDIRIESPYLFRVFSLFTVWIQVNRIQHAGFRFQRVRKYIHV
jgi:hypothetical protein